MSSLGTVVEQTFSFSFVAYRLYILDSLDDDIP